MKAPKHHRLPITSAGFERLRRGHPWISASQLTPEFPAYAEPGLLRLGEHWFFYSPKSELRLRRLGPATRNWGPQDRETCFEVEQFDEAFAPLLKEQFRRSLSLKQSLVPGESCFRWIFSEADHLPGLILDVFASTLVAQLSSAPVEKYWIVLKRCLTEVFLEATGKSPEWKELRNAPSRRKEGLSIETPLPQPEAGAWHEWNGLRWWMNPGEGQKTGAYLDQRESHRAAVKWARVLGLSSAWDLCSFEGGFGLHLAKAGLSVLAVDQSEEALARAQRNAEANGIPAERYATQHQDVFLFLREAFDAGRKSPAIILDPPSFVKNRSEKENALRGFKELNLRAFHNLPARGLLVSCSCSHHIHRDDYGEMLRAAAHDARRSVRVLEVLGPSPDHAPLLGFSESEYLQAWFLAVD